jgi:hypothetical protein
MKKILLLVPALILVAACSSPLKKEPLAVQIPLINEPAVCAVSTTTTRELLPPISQEEKSKTFTYEDEELGVKLKYPGSCYFNKGIFQCSSFTMSIWPAENQVENITNPEITFKDGETQLVYSFNKNNKTYQLLAWYDGQNKVEIDAAVDKIAKTFTFTR